MKYCLDCGFVGDPKQNTPGTCSLELKLWLFFVIPGIIYSVWRRLARYRGCAKCGNRHLVATDSPIAQDALRRLSPRSVVKPWFCTACGEPIFSGRSYCEGCESRASRASEAVTLVRV